MKLSVIVCTCNRANKLGQLLESASQMFIPPGLAWELIVVDNNSSDDTKRVVEAFANKIAQIKYISESSQGKSFALNHGLREAKGSIIAFTDDDAILDQYWVSAIMNEFSSDPTLSILGGRVELHDDNDLNIAVRTSTKRKIATSLQDSISMIIGINMAVSSELIKAVGNFDTDFGPGTSTRMVFEDTDLLYRAYKEGNKLVYSPNVLVYHNHGRRSPEDRKLVNETYVLGRGGFYFKYISRGDWDVLRLACQEVAGLFKDFLATMVTGQFPRDTMYQLSGLAKGFFLMGKGKLVKNFKSTV